MPLPTTLAIAIVLAVVVVGAAANAQSPAAGSEPSALIKPESRTGTRHGALLGARPTEYPD